MNQDADAPPAAPVTAYLGMGSNLGTRAGHLAFGLRELRRAGQRTGVSSVYESEPVGYIEQGAFLNLVVRLRTDLAPRPLLERMLGIERDAGRVRTVPQGPRTLDIDLLLYGRRVVETAGLSIPHPRMTDRPFVLVPLLELDPDLTDPTTGRPYAAYLERSDTRAVPVDLEAAGLRRVMDGEALLAD